MTRTRVAIGACALALGYNINWIVKGVYWLAPFAVVLAVVLIVLIVRSPKQPTNLYRSNQ